MEPIKKRFVIILSNGSISFCYKYFKDFKQIKVYEKDNKNFYLNRKFLGLKSKTKSSSKYKNKYLV